MSDESAKTTTFAVREDEMGEIRAIDPEILAQMIAKGDITEAEAPRACRDDHFAYLRAADGPQLDIFAALSRRGVEMYEQMHAAGEMYHAVMQPLMDLVQVVVDDADPAAAAEEDDDV